MKVENNEVVLTNREYFTKFCYFYGNDLCQIWRMWLKHLDKTVGRDAPMWEKEAQYEAFMDSEFDRSEWEAAKLKTETRPSSPLLTKIQRRVMAVE